MRNAAAFIAMAIAHAVCAEEDEEHDRARWLAALLVLLPLDAVSGEIRTRHLLISYDGISEQQAEAFSREAEAAFVFVSFFLRKDSRRVIHIGSTRPPR